MAATCISFSEWCYDIQRDSQVALVVKNLPANAGDVRDMGSISGLGLSPASKNV